MSEKLISEKWLSDYLDGYDAKVLEPAALQMLNNFYAELIEAPAVDAVEVIRCEKCIYTENDGCGEIYCQKWDRWEMPKDFFCKFGERREENAVD